MARRMLRYQVIVNDRAQTFRLGGNPVHVAAGRLGAGPDAQHLVEFWAEDYDIEPGGIETRIARTFQVFGTGHPLPEHARWRGTTARTPEGLVWHLYELPGEAVRA